MAVRIEDAGFEIRDMIAWVYGSGFPKSLDVSKAIDKAAGEIRPRVAGGQGGANAILGARKCGEAISGEAISGEAQQWAGWGTALKPALEPITVARKPLIGTVAENVLAHGTGALNVDGCRVKLAADEDATALQARSGGVRGFANEYVGGKAKGAPPTDMRAGRWPANLIHDGSDEVVGLFPSQAGGGFGVRGGHSSEHLKGKKATYEVVGFGDTGSAARFFYCAKASKRDRDEGCEGTELRQPSEKTRRHPESVGLVGDASNRGQTANPFANGGAPSRNHHPTVKPTDLMRYLCRLVTPPGGTVLDPFMGSGSTGKAAMLEGFDFIGIERDPEYVKIAEARIGAARRLL
jgi:site-specific DNA-methyltransferase (adenine-specific)